MSNVEADPVVDPDLAVRPAVSLYLMVASLKPDPAHLNRMVVVVAVVVAVTDDSCTT